MTEEAIAPTSKHDREALNDVIISAMQDIKAKDIVLIDLNTIPESPADYFIICGADSTTQVNGIADSVLRNVKEDMGLRANHKEGMANGRWVLIDFFDTIVHIFYHETRSYYELEDLWSDGKVTQYENL